MQYVAPAICLMAGLGAAALLSRVPGPRASRLAMLALFLSGIGMVGWDVSHPYKSEFDGPSRDFARQLWADPDAELACGRTDFRVDLDPKGWRNDRSALYLCHQAIYSPRHRGHKPVAIDRVGPGRPLRCVVFQEKPSDMPGVNRWLRSMDDGFVLRSRTETVVNEGASDQGGHFEDRYVIYEFVPKNLAATPKLPPR